MVRVIFNYGTMNSGKTTNLLTTKYQFEHYGMKTKVYKPALDTRYDDNAIVSRTGLECRVDGIIDTLDNNLLNEIKKDLEDGTVIFIDECQFLKYNDIIQLGKLFSISQSDSIVLAYGLLKDYNNKLFKGTMGWLEVADKLSEIKSMCQEPNCKAKATCNLLNKNIEHEGNVLIGDNIYSCYCKQHWYKHMEG